MKALLASIIATLALNVAAHDVEDHRDHQSKLIAAGNEPSEGLELTSPAFPIELFLDRGRLLGCIFDGRFFSLGSILIEESLPRKCELGPARTGVWQELTDIEMEIYLEHIEKQQATEQKEELTLGNQPLSNTEKQLIRLFRFAQAQEQKSR